MQDNVWALITVKLQGRSGDTTEYILYEGSVSVSLPTLDPTDPTEITVRGKVGSMSRYLSAKHHARPSCASADSPCAVDKSPQSDSRL